MHTALKTAHFTVHPYECMVVYALSVAPTIMGEEEGEKRGGTLLATASLFLGAFWTGKLGRCAPLRKALALELRAVTGNIVCVSTVELRFLPRRLSSRVCVGSVYFSSMHSSKSLSVSCSYAQAMLFLLLESSTTVGYK